MPKEFRIEQCEKYEGEYGSQALLSSVRSAG